MIIPFLHQLLINKNSHYLTKSTWFSCFILNIALCIISTAIMFKLSSAKTVFGVRFGIALALYICLCLTTINNPSEFLHKDLGIQGIQYLKFCRFTNKDFLMLGFILTAPCAVSTSIFIGTTFFVSTKNLTLSLITGIVTYMGLLVTGATLSIFISQKNFIQLSRQKNSLVTFASNRIICMMQRYILLVKKKGLLLGVSLWLLIDFLTIMFQFPFVVFLLIARFLTVCLLIEFIMINESKTMKFQRKYYHESFSTRALALAIPNVFIIVICVIATIPISFFFGNIEISYLFTIIPCCLLQLILGRAMLYAFEITPLSPLWQAVIGLLAFLPLLLEIISLVIITIERRKYARS